ncbi:hypothetical protein PVAP13_3KG179600 [Panicum virgatum]|uniref:Uncharacterized protein n=1 Tax=Panicum virgatum TaxID=38727 RepID=A0A8T0UVB0_PANVG|nr:hypothetical protein PVAP13_3KG179600 [Panicum virgatum]
MLEELHFQWQMGICFQKHHKVESIIFQQVKQAALQQKFYFQCKSPASSIIFYRIGISDAAVVTQNSSFTNGNLEVQEGRSRSVCLQNFLPFCQYIFHLLDGGFLYINTKYKGAVINKAFNCGKARLDLTQGM